MDKFVEFVIGDGPNNRYALLCSQCHSHNGMALPEDFEYTTFRCAYCYTVNPARRNTSISAQNVYKLPNLQVKVPIVKEITDGGCGSGSTEPCVSMQHSTPDPSEGSESQSESELMEDEGSQGHDSTIHEAPPDKDIADLLSETDLNENELEESCSREVETADTGC